MAKENIQQIPKEDREAIYKEIMAGIKPVADKYDETVVRWALNRHLKERREIEKAKADKAEAEARLKELGVK
jgi:hypothetical protein